MCNDDLDDIQEQICQTLNAYQATLCEGSAVLGVILAKICLMDPAKALSFVTSFMSSYSKTIQKNRKEPDANSTP